MTEKLCRKCGQVKPLTEFGSDKGRKGDLTSACRVCRNKQSAAWRRKNPARVKALNAAHRENRRAYYQDPKRKLRYRSQGLMRSFGIAHEDYERLLADQGGVCAICRRHRVASGKSYMAVDHCHTTKKIRGILCSWCNRALGLFEDNLEFLETAIQYLKGDKK